MFKKTPAPEPAAEWVPIAKLLPWVKNPRKNDAAVPKVAESMRRFGFGAPILARKANGQIIAGHTRLRAAIQAGIDPVPVRYLDLTEKEAELLSLADNRLGEIAEWDDTALAELLRQLEPKELEATGFTEKDLERLLAEALAPAQPEAVDPTSQYLVLVTCKDEQHQAQVLEQLMAEGLDVKAMIS